MKIWGVGLEALSSPARDLWHREPIINLDGWACDSLLQLWDDSVQTRNENVFYSSSDWRFEGFIWSRIAIWWCRKPARESSKCCLEYYPRYFGLPPIERLSVCIQCLYFNFINVIGQVAKHTLNRHTPAESEQQRKNRATKYLNVTIIKILYIFIFFFDALQNMKKKNRLAKWNTAEETNKLALFIVRNDVILVECHVLFHPLARGLEWYSMRWDYCELDDADN